ncbi:MAG: hypothetical protein NC318_13530 [Blautia sp.]|nr:hypothetical protein [Blautia sp.]
MLKQTRIGIVLLSISILLSLSGCGRSAKQEDSGNIENTMTDIDSNYDSYEYYLTKEELITDIEQGYIFRLDTEFGKGYAPYVEQGNWSFYVHEDNMVNLEVSFSNLLMKSKESIFPMSEQVVVEVISPDEETVYRFEKAGDEITQDTSVQEKISVTEGEWTLRVRFGYYCGDTPACLKIAAAYETPTKEDINWLKEERLADKISGYEGENSADNKTLYENTIATLENDEKIAFVDIGEKNDVLFTANQVWEDEQGNNTATFCNVYYAIDGKVYNIGAVESMGTAYPIRYGEKYIYAASGNSLVIYAIDVETPQLSVSSRYLVTYDEEGNTVYSHLNNEGKEQAISAEEFDTAFESYMQSNVISFQQKPQ